MKNLNEFIKLFYKQHAGELQLDILGRQYIKIKSDIEYLYSILKSNIILKNPEIYKRFSSELEILNNQYNRILNDASKTKKQKKKALEVISGKRNTIFQNPEYINSFEKPDPDRVHKKIQQLTIEKDKINLKILLKKKNIKNEKDFLRYYDNIDSKILYNYNNYIIKNIRYNKIKDKKQLKIFVLLLKKLIKLKSFAPLFEDNKEIKNILNEGKIDISFNRLGNKIFEIEALIKKHFEEKEQEVEINEDRKKIITYAHNLLSNFNFDSYHILLRDFPNNFINLFTNNIINYSINDFINDYITNPLEEYLNEREDLIINQLKLYETNPENDLFLLESEEFDEFDEFDDETLYKNKSKRKKVASKIINKIKSGNYKHKLSEYYHSKIIINIYNNEIKKADLLNLSTAINKLKLIFYYNNKYLFEYLTFNKLNLSSIQDIFNHIKTSVKFNFLEEIFFMEEIFSKMEVKNKNIFNNIKYLFNFMIKYDLMLDDYSFIINFKFPLSNDELEIFIDNFKEEINDPKTSKFYTENYMKYSEFELKNFIPESMEKPTEEQIKNIIKYKYYKENIELSYDDRKSIFIDSFKQIFDDGLDLILKLENQDTSSNIQNLAQNFNYIHRIGTIGDNLNQKFNYFSKISFTGKPKLDKLDKIKLEFMKKKSNLENLASNLVDKGDERIFNGDDIEIFQIRNVSESIRIGKNTAWCTAGTGKNQFCSYHKPKLNNLFIIQPKGDKKSYIYCQKTVEGEVVNDQFGEPKLVKSFLKYQLDVAGYHLMDSCDDPIEICDLIDKFPELSYFLRFIPYYEYSCRELKLKQELELSNFPLEIINLEERKVRFEKTEARRRRRRKRRSAAADKQ
jgi:hypothetical protein